MQTLALPRGDGRFATVPHYPIGNQLSRIASGNIRQRRELLLVQAPLAPEGPFRDAGSFPSTSAAEGHLADERRVKELLVPLLLFFFFSFFQFFYSPKTKLILSSQLPLCSRSLHTKKKERKKNTTEKIQLCTSILLFSLHWLLAVGLECASSLLKALAFRFDCLQVSQIRVSDLTVSKFSRDFIHFVFALSSVCKRNMEQKTKTCTTNVKESSSKKRLETVKA